MSDNERFRRPEPPRQGPVRNWSTLFGGFAPPGAGPAGDPQDPHSTPGDTATPDSVVSRAVELGYKVIEEQIQQGQRAAEQLSRGKIDPGMVSGNLSEVAERLMRVSSDVAALWLELLNSVVRNPAMNELFQNMPMPPTAHGSGSAPHAGGNGAGQPAASHPASMAVEIVSSVPTGARASVDLHAETAHDTFVFGSLRTRTDDKPPLLDVSLVAATEDWPASVRVTIPERQPAGTYSGLIINGTTDEPVGTLCVYIPDTAKP